MSNLESDYLEDDSVSAVSEQVGRGSGNEKSSRGKGGLESASNKRMRLANINPWTLRYNDEALESKVIFFFVLESHYFFFVQWLTIHLLN